MTMASIPVAHAGPGADDVDGLIPHALEDANKDTRAFMELLPRLHFPRS